MENVFIVRDRQYGDIDSLWLDPTKAEERRQWLIENLKPPYYRDFTWVVEPWEVK